jgi:hypothetical protein
MSGNTSKAALAGAVIAGVLVVLSALTVVWRFAEQDGSEALSIPTFARSEHTHHPRHGDNDDPESDNSGEESGGGTMSNTVNGVPVQGGYQYNGHTISPSHD